jgi:cob(I)alamin adenosyltransferase
MAAPSQPVTVSAEQLDELNKKLAALRHDINGSLSLIVAALEMIRFKPQTAERMMTTLAQQPPKIADHVAKFSAEFERTFGIGRT